VQNQDWQKTLKLKCEIHRSANAIEWRNYSVLRGKMEWK